MKPKLIYDRYEIIRQIDEGGISRVYLGFDHTSRNEVIVRMLKPEILSNHIEDIIRFRNEAAILSRLDHAHIVKIYEAFEYENHHYIIMEYISGESLYKIIRSGKKITEKVIIEILVQVCQALDYIHQQNIVHRDLKPGNIMVAVDEKGAYHIKVIDFGLAFIKEFTAINDAEEIAGTFCYMSPEHFRVINRSVDERSDLYSLGIIFYQLLSGVLPFEGKSTGSIIHQQLAMPPLPPAKHNESISETLEKIILKLLEKEPDKRYQSARGLEQDLVKYKQGERKFPLGMNDKQVRLLFTTGLLSREEELKNLKGLYDNTLKGQGSVCFIAGEAGKGKTRLAEELRSYVYREGGVFIDGKCFSGKNKTPYGAFKDALNIYVKKFRDYPEDKKQDIKNKLKQTIGELCGIMLQLNPALSVILDKCPKLVRLEVEREKKRFLMVAAQFLLALSRIEKGLVLFIDDLQWVDDGSMDLLSEISLELNKNPLLIIGTYRNDEINTGHRVNTFKQELDTKQYAYSEIYLDAFNKQGVDEFVKSLLNTKDENIENITEVIYQKSKGNPFFALEILKQFVDDKVVYLKADAWEINKEKLNKTEIAPTIVDIVMKRISWLSEEEVKVLSYAAVIGRKFDVAILFRLLDYEAAEIIRIVDRAIQLQLLDEDLQERGALFFVHDRIKEAFYKKCGDKERMALHKKIGKTLEQMNQGSTDRIIFDLAYHFIEGKDDEKILEYGYPAGVKAGDHYAYEEALRYLTLTNTIIEERGERGRELWVNTNRSISEIYLIIGRNDEAIDISRKILPYIESKLKKADIYKQITKAYFKKGDWQKCEQYGRQGLALLGEKIPIGTVAAVFRIIKEFIIHIIHIILPTIFVRKNSHKNSAKYELILAFHGSLNWTYVLNDILKFVGATLRLLNLAESKLGNSIERGIGLAGYASICMAIPLFKHAIRLHEKALNQRKELKDEWGVAQSLQFLGFCYQWKGEYAQSIRCFSESLNIFKKIGDVWEIKMNLSGLDMNYFYAADYEKSQEYNAEYMKVCEQLNDNFGKSGALADFGFIKFHQGEYELALENAEKSLAIAEQNKITLINCIAHILIGMIHKELGHYKTSFKYLKKACQLYENNNLLEYYTTYVITYMAEENIVELWDLDLDKIDVKKKELVNIKKLCKKALVKTKPWKIHYAHALRVNALYNALISKNRKSERLFLQSIHLAQNAGFKYELARSFYEYGRFLLNSGKTPQAKLNLESAYAIFKEIGSKVYIRKVSELLGVKEMEDKEGTAPIQRLKNQERLASIIKVSQTISSILILDLLLKNIIALAMEITGAQSGYLFIRDEQTNELVLKIKRSICEEKNDPTEGTQQECYSKNIVDMVFKSGEVVLTSDAGKDNEYAKYESVVQYGLKSVLCVPIKHQNVIIGVCYLDNPLSAAVFSKDDIEILEAMMAQAAISIENAQLYEKMKLKKDKAESEVEKLTIHISKKKEKLLDEKNSLVYQSKEMQEVVEKVSQAIRLTRPALITGETGTGKELIAKLIHYSGEFRQEPFIAINCAAVPNTLWEAELFGYMKGSFTDATTNRVGSIEAAGRGTLFFDEIGEMPLGIQSKLLRMLQENQYRPLGSTKTRNSECRFVFSTNRNLEEMIKQGTFREDLYYRINVFTINTPSLRKRPDDIPILLEHFIKKFSQEFDLPSDIEVEKKAMQKILDYSWPGNIREMENFVIRALAVLSSSDGSKSVLGLSHFPANIGIGFNIDDEIENERAAEDKERIMVDGNYDDIMNQHAKQMIQWALTKSKGNKTVAAEILGIKRTTLNYKIKELEIE
ncbi:MAG: sigma 54-interacting transcriptional regulator [Spirochaetales bacterium]|nr:sigma 54-interacting transcriptional regulator [Spirochaetales bacterium]